MRVIVTGVAGFVGSHVARELLSQGAEVVGVDAFLEFPDTKARKVKRLQEFLANPLFTFLEMDLRGSSLEGLVQDGDRIVHLAAMPGLMRSWSDLDLYVGCNVTATGRLLEESGKRKNVRFLHVSTSSVHGKVVAPDLITMPRPASPYGVSKLAAEVLCQAYVDRYGLQAFILRLFSVYGPGQRADMAFYEAIRAAAHKDKFIIYGDGKQTRTNTYVGDVARAVSLALDAGRPGEIYDVSGSEVVSLLDAIDVISSLVGRRPELEFAHARPGDQRSTEGNTMKAHADFGFQARVPFSEGIRAQVESQLQETDSPDRNGLPVTRGRNDQ